MDVSGGSNCRNGVGSGKTVAGFGLGSTVACLALVAAMCGCIEESTIDYKLLEDNASLLSRAVNAAADKAVTGLDARIGITVAVVNVENAKCTDEQPNAKLYDAIMLALIERGMTPIERDDEVLVRLAHEALDSLPTAAITDEGARGVSFDWKARAEVRRTGDGSEPAEAILREVLKTTSKTTMKSTPGGDVMEKTDSTEYRTVVPQKSAIAMLETSAKVLAYRLVECGIRYGYDKGDSAAAKAGLTRRNARVALNVRLVDAKTGRVEGATIVDEVIHDYVPTRELRALEGNLYKDFNHYYPSVKTWRDLQPKPAATPDAGGDAMVRKGPKELQNSVVFGFSGVIFTHMRRKGLTAFHGVGVELIIVEEERWDPGWGSFRTDTDPTLGVHYALFFGSDRAHGGFRVGLDVKGGLMFSPTMRFAKKKFVMELGFHTYADEDISDRAIVMLGSRW